MLADSTPPSTTSLILGSAAIGALVSSVLTLIGQWRERKARRSELLLSESVKLAMAHHSAQVEYAKHIPGPRFIPEHIRLVHTYYGAMQHLLGTGKLPAGIFKSVKPVDGHEFDDAAS